MLICVLNKKFETNKIHKIINFFKYLIKLYSNKLHIQYYFYMVAKADYKCLQTNCSKL